MRKLASIRKITDLQPIKGADRIELAIVDGWKCVIKKGEYAIGEKIIYCEIDSILPVREEFEFLRKSSYRKMNDKEGFRLRTIRLRGQVSQGLVLPATILKRECQIGEDVSTELGIEKYEAPIPTQLTGEVVGAFPSFIRKTNEERIQNLSEEFPNFKNKMFRATEKLDGTSLTVFYYNDKVGVCGRNWEYHDDPANSYWRVVHENELVKKLEQMGRSIAFQGELIGPGIQGNPYKLTKAALYLFNAFDIAEQSYVSKSELSILCETLGLNEVPTIIERELPNTIDDVLEFAEGKSVLNKEAEREGLVWVCGSGQDRISFKSISNRFLTKK